MRSAWRRAALTSRSRCGVSLGMIATPSGSSPSKISALASAIASSEPRFSMCAGAIAVISATCGRTCARQRGDLAFVVHAHFEHRIFGVARHPGEAQRHAGMVVVALDRAVDLARPVAVERGVKRFLGAGLADRAGDPENRRAGCARATRGRAPGAPRSVVDQDVRAVDRLRDDRAGGARGERARRRIVAVVDGARHGDEQVARADFAAVEGDAGHFERRARGPARRGGDLVAGPQRAHAAHSLATKASSNGSTRSPTIWPGLVALAGDQDDVAGARRCGSLRRSPRAARRPRSRPALRP